MGCKIEYDKQGKSIAVLPFTNMSSDPENEYFSDGITEEIINALTRVQGLKVIARTSSFAFKNKNDDIRSIAKLLGVSTVLEGSVRKSENKVRITAQLIRAADGFHLWSQKFDRKLEDIFAVQDEISLLIADQIRENFGHLDIARHLVEAPNINVDSYHLYLKGRFYLHKFNKDDIKKGITILEGVASAHPDFPLAHVDIHYGYNMMAAGGLMPAKEALTIGKKNLDIALKLDEAMPECHHSLGWHSLNWNWDFIRAVNHLTRAIQLRPGYADAHQKMFITLVLEGKIDASFEHINTALQLDPLSTLNNYFMGYYYYVTGQFEASNRYLEKAFELEPSFIVGYSIYSLSLFMQNRPDYILQKAAAIPDMKGADDERLLMQTLAYCKLGDSSKISHGIEKLKQALNGENKERVRFFLIYIETVLENFENAFKLIEEGISHHEPLMTLLKVDPLLKPLHRFDQWHDVIEIIYNLSDQDIPHAEETSSSQLKESELKRFQMKLNDYMKNEAPYLSPSLSLRQLSEAIGLHPNKLSLLINVHIKKNFNEYINSWRFEEFKSKALNPSFEHLSLLGLAYESGFSSKTVFNAYFKKTAGMTPKEWLKSER